MAITARTLTGSLLDVQGVPKGANVQQAWIGSSKATIVDAPSTIRVGKVVPLTLSGAGAFTVSLPDSAQAGVLYSLWATWVEPAGARRQTGPTPLGTFHLTADAQIGAVLETSDGQIPQSTADALGARLTAAEGKLVPAGSTANTVLTWIGPGAHDVVWGNPATGINFDGVLESTDDLPATGASGHGWVIDGDLWLWVDDHWTNVGGFRGPQGVPGLGLPDPVGVPDGHTAVVDGGAWTTAPPTASGPALAPDPGWSGAYTIPSGSPLTPDPDWSGAYLIGA